MKRLVELHRNVKSGWKETDYTGRWKIETKYTTSPFGEYVETLLFLECFDIYRDRVYKWTTVKKHTTIVDKEFFIFKWKGEVTVPEQSANIGKLKVRANVYWVSEKDLQLIVRDAVTNECDCVYEA